MHAKQTTAAFSSGHILFYDRWISHFFVGHEFAELLRNLSTV